MHSFYTSFFVVVVSKSIIKTLKEKANHDFMDGDDDVKQICAKKTKQYNNTYGKVITHSINL